jgi:signal transduction histidine kinase
MHVTHRVKQAAIVVGLLALQLLVLLGVPPASAPLLLLDLGVAAAGLAVVPLLPRRPVVVGVILGGLAALSPVGTPAATGAAFGVAQSRPFRSSAAVAGVGIVAHLVLNLWRPREGISYWWWALLVVVAYATLVGWGAYLRARRELIASLRERAERAEAEQARRVAEARGAERARIAREMHDVLAHRLSLVATHAGALEYRPDASAEQVAAAAGVVRAGVHQALDELREVIFLLRDADDADDSASPRLRPAPPQPTLVDLPRLLDDNAAAGARIELHDLADDVRGVPTTLSRAAYRIVQEALTNARRHAPGQPVSVTLRGNPGDTLEVAVSNPLGPAALRTDSAAESTAGFGLVGLAERVELVGGQLAHTRTATGFEVRARLPWGQ